MSVSLRTITGGILTAAEHAMMNFGAFPHDGFLNPTVNIQIDGSSIHFNDDIYGLIAGRMFRITDETFSFVLPISGTLAGTIYLKLDLDNVDAPLQLLSTTETPPAETTFESGVVNFDSQEVIKYLCTFNVTPTAITDLSVVFPVGIWGDIDVDHLPVVPIEKGGTGATTAASAINALLPNSNTTDITHFLGVNGSWVGGSVKLADVRTLLHIYDSEHSRTKNYVLAAPSNANGAAVFRKLVAADLPAANALGGVLVKNAGEAYIWTGINNATVYRLTITTAGNLRIDKSTDGGNNWTLGEHYVTFNDAVRDIAHGGTGATTAANARTNLGITCTRLWNGTLQSGSATFTYGGYIAYIVMAKPSGGSWNSVIIPAGSIGTSNSQWQIADDSTYISFYIKYSGTTGTLTYHARTSGSNGSIGYIYGIN